MQSSASFITRCACAVRGAVMGCCYSLCHKDDDVQESRPSETTRLLVEPVREEAPPARAAAPAAPRKHDDTTALSRILQETATNVIDVGALGPHALEPHEYSERMRTYQSKLGAAPPAGAPPPPARLLRDVTQAERTLALSQEPLAAHDRDTIANAVKMASAAMSELRVEHREDLVVPFQIP